MTASLADPPGTQPLVSAMLWLEHTLLGTVAVTIAVMAVAVVGLRTLTGRIHLRYGATVVLGCFVLFGAARIAAGIQMAAQLAAGGTDTGDPVAVAAAVVIPPSLPASDPYAGASLQRP